jgi:hypothetical protein
MTLHQPDLNLPDRLLATCGECRAWYMIFLGPGLMIRLPDEGAINQG